MSKIFSVAIIGCGARGCEIYGRILDGLKDRYKILSLCDVNEEKLEKYAKIFQIDEKNRFNDEDVFFQEKRADLALIATQDADHVRQCLKALKLGYDVMLEKPITDSVEECEELLAAQKQYGGKVVVCHVLRYAPAYKKVGELLFAGAIGRLVSIQALEQVSYWHQAHSYVRGNWRSSETATPMILAKCCHDLDLLQYYARSECASISSVGDLTYFNADHAPEGSAARCVACKYVDTCPYSAKQIYVERWKAKGEPENIWPFNILTPVIPLTEEALTKAIEEGPYGRCVFRCDNDVVDHQFTQMTFKNGVKASLLMTGFTAGNGRIMKFYGTLGEIEFDEGRGWIAVKPFGKEVETFDIRTLIEEGYAHGGGDAGLIHKLYDILSGTAEEDTSLKASVESHKMGICAEESRKANGKLIYLH